MSVPLQNTAEWLEWRRGGIGASELHILLGEDPYRSEYQLALEKRGQIEPESENDAMRWGHRVQRLGLEVYAEATGRKVRNVNTTATSKRWPHVYASLDGLVVGERRGVEVKWTRGWDGEPPPRVVVQCLGQMGVKRLDAVDVVRLGPYGQPEIHTVERDDVLIRELLQLGEDWYVRYVLGDELPPVDGSRAASRALDRVKGQPEMVADGEQAALVARLHSLKGAMKAAEAEHDLIVNRLKDSMHGSYALVGQGFRVSWKPSKGRTTVDWHGVASDLAPDTLDAWEAIVAKHTTTSEGARPFRVTVEEGPHD